jgi:uncharacterized protein (TIGR00251 family)
MAQPKASKSEIVDWHEDELKVRLAAPPVDGAANTALIEAFAKWCKVRKSAITMLNGQTSRHKHLVIEAPTLLPDILQQRLSLSA